MHAAAILEWKRGLGHACVKFEARALARIISSSWHPSLALIPKWPRRDRVYSYLFCVDLMYTYHLKEWRILQVHLLWWWWLIYDTLTDDILTRNGQWWYIQPHHQLFYPLWFFWKNDLWHYCTLLFKRRPEDRKWSTLLICQKFVMIRSRKSKVAGSRPGCKVAIFHYVYVLCTMHLKKMGNSKPNWYTIIWL